MYIVYIYIYNYLQNERAPSQLFKTQSFAKFYSYTNTHAHARARMCVWVLRYLQSIVNYCYDTFLQKYLNRRDHRRLARVRTERFSVLFFHNSFFFSFLFLLYNIFDNVAKRLFRSKFEERKGIK